MKHATPAETAITVRALNRATLARQMLLGREKATVAGAIGRLVGLQAQVARPPFVGLWTRLAGFTREDLLAALQKRQVVRVTAMRATLHLMSAPDYVALRGALQPALSRGYQAIRKGRNATFDISVLDALGREFFAREAAPFDALREVIKARFPKGDERAMAYAIRCTVPLVQVPDDSAWGFPAQAGFTLADTWLKKKVPVADAPARALVRRYLAAFGPATPADAQAWSALQGLRDVFDAMRPELVTFRDERKRELFDLPEAPRPHEDTPAPVRFLPDFDNVILSHADRSRVIADAHRPRVTTKNLQVPGTFLVDGMVAGTWKAERKKAAATLLLTPFGSLRRKTESRTRGRGRRPACASLNPTPERASCEASETAPVVATTGLDVHPPVIIVDKTTR